MLCAERGVDFRFLHDVRRLHEAGGRIAGVEVTAPQRGAELLVADRYVVALGSYSALLLRGIGIPIWSIRSRATR